MIKIAAGLTLRAQAEEACGAFMSVRGAHVSAEVAG